MVGIAELWHSHEQVLWDEALERYWGLIRPENLEIERELEHLDSERIRALDQEGWYTFLRDEYYRWKYTAPNRYATTTQKLRQYIEQNRLDELHRLKERLLDFDQQNIALGLRIASEIQGLGTAGASGLLALLYPKTFATVDQFVVKALRDVGDLLEALVLNRMNHANLTIKDAVVLIGIMRSKADENNQIYQTDIWTARRVDKVLWTYGR